MICEYKHCRGHDSKFKFSKSNIDAARTILFEIVSRIAGIDHCNKCLWNMIYKTNFDLYSRYQSTNF